MRTGGAGARPGTRRAPETPIGWTFALAAAMVGTAGAAQGADGDEAAPGPAVRDHDLDGYCAQGARCPPGLDRGDCDDGDPATHPDAEEVAYDAIDQDCDGADLMDVDGDGFRAVQVGGPDCDDLDEGVNPSNPDDGDGDGIDDDCDGEVDEDAPPPDPWGCATAGSPPAGAWATMMLPWAWAWALGRWATGARWGNRRGGVG